MEEIKGVEAMNFKDRKSWRQWLTKNHATKKAVLLILHNKKSKSGSISLDEAVMEALCFGWIDSKAMKRDDDSRYQYFSPRKPKSNWSRVNRARVEQLTKEGLIKPAGQAMIDLAKSTGTWDALVSIENDIMPEDLQKRFARNKKALKNFLAFAPSARRVILQWVLQAKRPETRKIRVEKTVMAAAENLKAYP